MSARVIETDTRDEQEERWIDSESENDDWGESEEAAIPPRPRGRLLRPMPLLLIAVTIAAAGFLGGVLAQKGSEGGGSASLPGGGSLPSLAAGGPTAGGSEAGAAPGGGESSTGSTSGGEAATGLPSFGASNAAADGTVTSVEGHTIYVKEFDGTIVAVKIGDGATVTRNSDVKAKKIHPGDSVTVEGSKRGSTVKASSVAATESGVESTAGLTVPGATTAGGESGGGGSEEASVESLFEE